MDDGTGRRPPLGRDLERLMTSTPTRRPRPELDLVAESDCACGPRCTLTAACLETALADDRFGIWVRESRPALRLAS
jgi:hypothetical protein